MMWLILNYQFPYHIDAELDPIPIGPVPKNIDFDPAQNHIVLENFKLIFVKICYYSSQERSRSCLKFIFRH